MKQKISFSIDNSNKEESNNIIVTFKKEATFQRDSV